MPTETSHLPPPLCSSSRPNNGKGCLHAHDKNDPNARVTNPSKSILIHLSRPLGLLGGLDGSVVGLFLGSVLSELGLVLGNRLLLGLGLPLLDGSEVSSSLESLGSDESLNGRGLGVGLAGFSGDLTTGLSVRYKFMQRGRHTG